MATYDLGNYEYDNSDFFPLELFQEITEVRVANKEIVEQEAQRRTRRDRLARDGNLIILAVDHPGRRVTSIRNDPLKMGDRYAYLGRAVRALVGSGFDGIMGTTDFIEDLFILNHLVKERGGDDFLSEKVLLGCMNRGGTLGTVFEMHDTYTSFTPKRLEEMRMDGGKMMYRLDPEAPGAGRTLTETADVITKMSERGLPAFLEPLSVKRAADGSYAVKSDPATHIKDISVAAALGSTSMQTWIKIPYCENYAQVARASTLPILMLGGAPSDAPVGVMKEFEAGMASSPTVRGALVGRNVTFPPRDDPRAVAAALTGIIHEGHGVEEAVEHLHERRGEEMDRLRNLM